jgi:hypothetical protein
MRAPTKSRSAVLHLSNSGEHEFKAFVEVLIGWRFERARLPAAPSPRQFKTRALAPAVPFVFDRQGFMTSQMASGKALCRSGSTAPRSCAAQETICTPPLRPANLPCEQSRNQSCDSRRARFLQPRSGGENAARLHRDPVRALSGSFRPGRRGELPRPRSSPSKTRWPGPSPSTPISSCRVTSSFRANAACGSCTT